MADSKKSSDGHAGTLQKQKRALLTRQSLLRAARAIFARDGFEHARLEDIAARAGRTRGAFYVNFKDKEDVFFAIFEEDIDSDLLKLGASLEGLRSQKGRMRVLAAHLAALSCNRERVLLAIEFKLYVIRHPQKRKRLLQLYATMRLRCAMPELDIWRQGAPIEAGPAEVPPAISCLMDGLALNHLFDPQSLSEDAMAAQFESYLSTWAHGPRRA